MKKNNLIPKIKIIKTKTKNLKCDDFILVKYWDKYKQKYVPTLCRVMRGETWLNHHKYIVIRVFTRK